MDYLGLPPILEGTVIDETVNKIRSGTKNITIKNIKSGTKNFNIKNIKIE